MLQLSSFSTPLPSLVDTLYPAHTLYTTCPRRTQVVGGVVIDLETVVRGAGSGGWAGEVQGALKYLLQLKALGVKAAEALDPVR